MKPIIFYIHNINFNIMSYIENKYREKIKGVFNELSLIEKDVLKTLEKKSIQESDFLAKLCSEVNKK